LCALTLLYWHRCATPVLLLLLLLLLLLHVITLCLTTIESRGIAVDANVGVSLEENVNAVMKDIHGAFSDIMNGIKGQVRAHLQL
jgi:hypothetical protein